MTLAGYWIVQATLEMVIDLSSSGCLSTSKVSLGNSVSSSKKRIPLWARLISPGVSCDHPPTIEILDAV